MQEDTVYYTRESHPNPERAFAVSERQFSESAESETEQIEPRTGRWISLGFVILLLLVVGMSVPAGIATAYYGDFIMPGVTGLGKDLGGQSVEQATETLQNDWLARQIVLQGANHSLTVTPTTLGITLDAAATARNARLLGREGDNLLDLATVYLHGASVQPVWQIDLAATAENLENYAHLYEIPAQDAQLAFVDGSLLLSPAASGQKLDVAAMTTWLGSNSAQALLAGEAPLLLAATQPTISEATLQPLWQQAQNWLSGPLTIRLYDPVNNKVSYLEISPVQWNNWVTMEADIYAEQSLLASVDATVIDEYLRQDVTGMAPGSYIDASLAAEAIADQLLGRLHNEPEQQISLRVYYHDRLHTVQFGETLSSIGRNYGIPYPWIQTANPDLGSNLSVGQQITIPSVDNFLPLPVVENKRIVVSISEQKMWAYEAGQLAFEWTVSTGIAASPTAPGIFQVQSFEVDAYAGNWDLQMPHFIGIYRPVPQSDFMNGFHGFPTRNGSNLLWTGDLGHPVTYGCVLVSSSNAVSLFDWAELGVVVEVLP